MPRCCIICGFTQAEVNLPSFVQMMASRLVGAKPLSEQMLEILLIFRFMINFSEMLFEIQVFLNSRKCIWKCRLRNVGHFISGSMCCCRSLLFIQKWNEDLCDTIAPTKYIYNKHINKQSKRSVLLRFRAFYAFHLLIRKDIWWKYIKPFTLIHKNVSKNTSTSCELIR